MNLWRHTVTDYDNATADTGRFIAMVLAFTAVGAVVAMALALVLQASLSAEHKVDLSAFGAGVGAVLGGIGGVLGGLAAYVICDGKGRRDSGLPPCLPPQG